MNPRRLALLSVLSVLATCPGWAANPVIFEGAGLIDLLRPTHLVGDGASPADMYILALAPDGAPIADMKLKMTVSGGTATDLVAAGGGLYAFTFTPAKIGEADQATFQLKGKLRDKTPVNASWAVPVAPSRSHQLAVVADPTALLLGTQKSASLAFTVTGGEAATLAGIQLGLNVSAGTVTNVVNLGGGQFSGLYTAPATTAAQVALVTAVDSADPMHTYGGVAVALSAQTDQAVTVAPGARVMLKVGGRDFGPSVADSRGRAKVPIVIPAGVSTGIRAQITADGKVVEAPFDLAVREARRIALFPGVATVPSDARLRIPVRAFVVSPAGLADGGGQVEFSTTAGTVGPATHEGGGVYVATFTPPAGNASVKASVTARIAGGSAIQAETRPLSLVPARAARLELVADPLPTAATTLTIKAKVTGPDGAGLAGRTLSFAANGAKLVGVEDLKNGDYKATFSTTGKGAVEVTATVAAPATGNALAQVLVLPARERLPPDGLSSAMLTVATLDEFGYPVPNREVSLRMLSGDGSLPTTVTTNAAGIAQVYYTAGRKSGSIGIEAAVGELAGGTTLVQAPATLTLPDLPTAGSAPTRAMMEEWTGSLAALRVERGG